jgi:hypothetical protein
MNEMMKTLLATAILTIGMTLAARAENIAAQCSMSVEGKNIWEGGVASRRVCAMIILLS